MDLLHYAIFLVPMGVVFFWLTRCWGVRQALLDLIAFNLMFDFDFGAIIPGGIYFLLLHFLLIGFIAYETLTIIERGIQARMTVRAILVLGIATLLTVWLVGAVFVNKIETWGIARTIWNTTRQYIFSALFIFVGFRLAVEKRFLRFGKIFLFASAINALIAIIQSASSGHLLTNIESTYYLGVFQPLGSRFLERRMLSEAGLDFTNTVRFIRLGNTMFYRGWGTFDGANSIMLAVAVLSFCLLIKTIGRRSSVPLALIIFFVLSCLAMIVALYRTALITFVIIIGGVILLSWRQLLSRRMLIQGVGILVVVILVLAPFLAPLSTIVAVNLDGFFGSRASQIGSLNNRDKVWAFAFAEISRQPILGSAMPLTYNNVGWGLNNDSDLDVTAHNSFIEYAYRGGLLPGVLFVSLYGFIIIRSVKLARNRHISAEQRDIFFALTAALLSLFVTHLVGSQMTITQMAALFWIPCGYLAAYHPKSPSSQAPHMLLAT